MPRSKQAHRYGVIMTAQPGNPLEDEGVCNPGGATGPDGHFYLFPRLVAPGNFSRIGLARVTRHPDGRPAGVKRLGLAVQPERTTPGPRVTTKELTAADYHGCEDARVVYVPGLRAYVMTYTALGSDRVPRIALAFSADLLTWSKAGIAQFERLTFPSLLGLAATQMGLPGREDDVATVPNKDGVFLPEPVSAPDGRLCWALIHRPMFRYSNHPLGIWISYCATTDLAKGDATFRQHRVLLRPEQTWERDRMGAGCVIRVGNGWALFYHGVEKTQVRENAPLGGTTQYGHTQRTYRAGLALLDPVYPHRVLGRTQKPILEPESKHERRGVVSNVVFPSAVEKRRGKTGLDLYYGMADSQIGCAYYDLTPTAAPAPVLMPAPERHSPRWGEHGWNPYTNPTPWWMRGLGL